MLSHRAFLTIETTVIQNQPATRPNTYRKSWLHDENGFGISFVQPSRECVLVDPDGNNLTPVKVETSFIPLICDNNNQWIIFQLTEDMAHTNIWVVTKNGEVLYSCTVDHEIGLHNPPIFTDNLLITESENGSIKIYDLKSGENFIDQSIFPYSALPPSLSVSSNQQLLSASTVFSGNYDFCLVDLSDNKYGIYRLFSLKEHSNIIFEEDKLGVVLQYNANNSAQVAWFSLDLSLYEKVDNSRFVALQQYYLANPITTNEAFNNALDKLGLMQQKEVLSHLIKPVIRLASVESEETLSLGTSHFGGSPDLKNIGQWPKNSEGDYIEFLGQINLHDIALVLTEDNPLPLEGLLSIFASDHDYNGEYQAKIVYHPSITELTEIEDPVLDERDSEYGTEIITFGYPQKLLPYEGSVLLDTLTMTRDETTAYNILVGAVNGAYFAESDDDEIMQYSHSLLGHPYPIQNNDMEMEAELIAQGQSPYEYPSDPEAFAALLQKSGEWTQLLELNETANFTFGDAGALYFFIKRSDLAAQRFDNIMAIMQCH